MNVEPLIIEPHVLTDLGAGDSAAGAKRLRLLIADARDRKPVVGPTERPQSVRIAVRSDEAALEDLLALDAAATPLAEGVTVRCGFDLARLSLFDAARGERL